MISGIFVESVAGRDILWVNAKKRPMSITGCGAIAGENDSPTIATSRRGQRLRTWKRLAVQPEDPDARGHRTVLSSLSAYCHASVWRILACERLQCSLGIQRGGRGPARALAAGRKDTDASRHLYPNLESLRPAQEEALYHVGTEERPDIVLAVPTAYGKTLVYVTAAIDEVVHRKGKR